MTTKEQLIMILKKAGLIPVYENKNYVEYENSSYGKNIIFCFDSEGNLIDMCS